MQNGPEAIVDAFYAAWILRDIETVAAYFSDNFRLSQHFSDPMLPFTGETIGKAAALARLQMILGEWRFLKFEPTLTVADGTSVRTTCPFILQHLRTGEIFDGSFRHIWRVSDGKLASVDEYLDVDRLRAFLRLLGLPA